MKILTNAIDPEEWFESQKIEGTNWADNIGNLFSFFMLFPRDHAIPTKRLVTLFIAKGLEKELSETYKHIAMNYLSELIELNLIMLFLRL